MMAIQKDSRQIDLNICPFLPLSGAVYPGRLQSAIDVPKNLAHLLLPSRLAVDGGAAFRFRPGKGGRRNDPARGGGGYRQQRGHRARAARCEHQRRRTGESGRDAEQRRRTGDGVARSLRERARRHAAGHLHPGRLAPPDRLHALRRQAGQRAAGRSLILLPRSVTDRLGAGAARPGDQLPWLGSARRGHTGLPPRFRGPRF